jgi:hypothetical protein
VTPEVEAIWTAEMEKQGFDRMPDIWFDAGYNRRISYWFFDGEWHYRLTEGDTVLYQAPGEP